LSSGDTFRETLHHLYDLEMDLARTADLLCHLPPPSGLEPSSSREVSYYPVENCYSIKQESVVLRAKRITRGLRGQVRPDDKGIQDARQVGIISGRVGHGRLVVLASHIPCSDLSATQ
jgi:hypothetical protein